VVQQPQTSKLSTMQAQQFRTARMIPPRSRELQNQSTAEFYPFTAMGQSANNPVARRSRQRPLASKRGGSALKTRAAGSRPTCRRRSFASLLSDCLDYFNAQITSDLGHLETIWLPSGTAALPR